MTESRVLAGRVTLQPSFEAGQRDFIFVRDLVLDVAIGAYPEEKGITQKVGFTVEASVAAPGRRLGDDLSEVPSYDDIIAVIRKVVSGGHINLVETMAERIAEGCLQDARIVSVRVRVEKLERGAGAVGVEIVRPRVPDGR